jgi:hypothetical protein
MWPANVGLRSSTLREGSFDVTTTDAGAERPGAARQRLLTRHPLLFFFACAGVC